MIPGQCPACGRVADLEFFVAAAEWNKALAAALNLPAPLAGRVIRYLGLFSPSSSHRLTPKKVSTILDELTATVTAAQLTRNKVTYPAPLAFWEAALDAMLAHPPERLPLKDNGYLFECVGNIAKRSEQRQAQQVEDRRHQVTHEAPRRGDLQTFARVVDRVAGKAGAAGLRDALGRRAMNLSHEESNDDRAP